MEYFEIMRAEQKPDCYGGENCDELIPMWDAYAEGDKESEHSDADIILKPKLFPPGTIVSVKIPCCPKCGVNAEICECGFDWKDWAQNKYS